MDPFTIVTIVVKVTHACLSTAKTVYEVRNKYKDAPLSIVTISSETSVISACLSELQTILCRKRDFVRLLETRPELTHALDASLTGCAVLFSCLDEELRNITSGSSKRSELSFKGKAKVIWNHDRLHELLAGLHRQQSAVNFLIQLIQLIYQKKGQSHPEINVPDSLFSPDDRQSLYLNAPSISGATEFEFDFDNTLINSKVYRRHFETLRRKSVNAYQPVIEGDLIDLSDSKVTVTAEADQVSRDLDCLVIQVAEETQNLPPKTSRAGSQQTSSSCVTSPFKGLRFQSYILGQTLNQNRRAKVKLGGKTTDGPQVAIKLIKRDLSDNGSVDLARTYREVTLLQKLSHPNIVRLCEMVETDRHIGIILEYVSGGQLFDYIMSHKHLEENSARKLFAQIISGVEYLHQEGIVHRKLDLQTILLDGNHNIVIGGFSRANYFNPEDKLGKEIELNISDASYAKRMQLDCALESGCRRGDLMLTRYEHYRFMYTAPELITGDSLYMGRKADVWSCGVILYAMLSGYLPWDDDPENPDSMNLRLLYKYIISNSLAFPKYVLPHARELLARMLVPDPRKRANLHEVAQDSWLSEDIHLDESIIVSETPEPSALNCVTPSHDVEEQRGEETSVV